MRSRYAAYVTGNAGYIVATTDPEGPLHQEDRATWLEEVRVFCRETEFLGLSVLETQQDEDQGEVHFEATLIQAGRDASFRERSRFRRAGGRWFYVEGQPY
jgi:SEC-C motif-containing protein